MGKVSGGGISFFRHDPEVRQFEALVERGPAESRRDVCASTPVSRSGVYWQERGHGSGGPKVWGCTPSSNGDCDARSG